MSEPALPDHLRQDTIASFLDASEHRYQEALALRDAGEAYGCIYLCGYVVEMILKASYFRLAGYGFDRIIKKEDRNAVLPQIRRLGASTSPHNLYAWALLIVEKRGEKPNPPEQLLSGALFLYGHWRETMRYHWKKFDLEVANTALAMARWYLNNHSDI